MESEKANTCLHANKCSGCPWIAMPYKEQIEKKMDNMNQLLADNNIDYNITKIHDLGPFYLRDRMDLGFYQYADGPRLGLYNLERKELVDFKECHQVRPKLWEFIKKFKENMPNISLASFRFRYAPDGKLGIWMDLPNKTTKDLLEEKKWLQSIMTFAKVEIGQKRKALKEVEGHLRLPAVEHKIWFETYIGKNLSAFPLYSSIGDFSQTGIKANYQLIKIIKNMIEDIEPSFAIELCSGIGNFSFFLASLSWNVEAHEWNKNSILACEKSKENFANPERIVFKKTNIHAKNKDFMQNFKKAKLVLADPPRSGLGSFVDLFKDSKEKPAYFIYISCFAKTYIEDIKKLEQLGYKIKDCQLLDQFTHSPHIEIISLLEYDN